MAADIPTRVLEVPAASEQGALTQAMTPALDWFGVTIAGRW